MKVDSQEWLNSETFSVDLTINFSDDEDLYEAAREIYYKFTNPNKDNIEKIDGYVRKFLYSY